MIKNRVFQVSHVLDTPQSHCCLVCMPLINVKLSTCSRLLVNQVSSFMKSLLNVVSIFLYGFNIEFKQFCVFSQF